MIFFTNKISLLVWLCTGLFLLSTELEWNLEWKNFPSLTFYDARHFKLRELYRPDENCFWAESVIFYVAAGFPSHWLKYCILQRGNLEVRGNIKPILSLLSAKYWFWHYQSTQHHCSNILPGIRDDFEWHDLQGRGDIFLYTPCSLENILLGKIFHDYNPQGKYQAHIPVCRSHHSKSSLLPGVQF